MIYIGIAILLLLILVLTGRKSVHHEILIKATPDAVWSVLMDAKSYQEWNPVLIPIEGELVEGARIRYLFRQDEQNESEIPSTVRQLIPQQLLNQGGGMPGVLTFDHRYILEEMADGTKVTIHEDYRGIGVHFWNPAPVEQAYGRLNEALKRTVEQQ